MGFIATLPMLMAGNDFLFPGGLSTLFRRGFQNHIRRFFQSANQLRGFRIAFFPMDMLLASKLSPLHSIASIPMGMDFLGRGFGHGFRQGVALGGMPVFLYFRQGTPECAVFIIAAAVMLVYQEVCVTANEISLAVIAVIGMLVQFQGIQRANRHPFPRRLPVTGIRMGMLRDFTFLFHGDGR